MTENQTGPSIPDRTLNDGTSLPEVGLGTYRLKGETGAEAMASAVHAGYRLLDSAYNYENEGAVGEGIRRSGVPREELRVTTKLPGRYQRGEDAVPAVEESLYRAGLEYFDLCLIHWPNPGQGLYLEAWEALIDLRARGLLRSIGVSNFLPEHIRELKEKTGVTPSVNQIEIHPWFPQETALAWHASEGIATQAWSPVGRQSALKDEPVVAEIAEATGRSPVQVLLRWHLERGVVPLPKSGDPVRQRENLRLFDFSLSAEQMESLAGLARDQGRLKGQDPAVYEEF